MSTLDLASIAASLYSRVKSDSAGSAVRALLGAGATSVIPARDLPKETGDLGLLPARPLLVWRRGVTSEVDQMWRAFGTWWAYVELDQGDRPLDQIVSALIAAYPRFCIPLGRVTVGPIGQPGEDRDLNLYGVPVQISYARRD